MARSSLTAMVLSGGAVAQQFTCTGQVVMGITNPTSSTEANRIESDVGRQEAVHDDRRRDGAHPSHHQQQQDPAQVFDEGLWSENTSTTPVIVFLIYNSGPLARLNYLRA